MTAALHAEILIFVSSLDIVQEIQCCEHLKHKCIPIHTLGVETEILETDITS